ncbi:uncharacterized protein LOC128708446 [Anopheles marshallii]|uniref:uncharacterized protein LOC128708446 n=1 Tax=Anopheles marshallii TaxID=1521116 RepID=UPI00237B1232|nr:uncharacterized protein LOC128708446 [Anopheles marshallii]
MDWRSSPRAATYCLRSIMALIVGSGSNRQWSFCRRKIETKATRQCTATAGSCLWSSCRRGLVLTSILLVTCLARPIAGSRERELHLQDYAVLSHVRSLNNPCKESGGAGTTTNQRAPPESGSVLKLSELVTQSDVIFKAFAGHGNDLRDAALNFSSMATGAAEHRQQQQQHHHQPRWKPQPVDAKHEAGADFIVRLEPGTVYKGNELFKQLQLNSWKHYFILWSNGSVQYTHRDVPVQGHTTGESFKPTESTTADTTYPDGLNADASLSSHLERRSAEPISTAKTTKPGCQNKRPGGTWSESTPSAVTEGVHDDSSFQPAHPIGTDNSIHSAAHNLDTDRSSPAHTFSNDDHKHKPLSADERVNLQQSAESNKSTLPEDETSDERAVPKSMGKDFESEGQISRTLSEILPVTLVVFGRLSTGGNDGGGATDKLLRVDPYVGLLRWDEQLEDALWQALGWSEWSDNTGCSVACGGGVQQRFRHCLQSAPSDRAGATEIHTESITPPPVTPSVATTRHRRNVLSSEIENPTSAATTARTQPVTFGAQPGVSITRMSYGNDDGDGKRKRKLKSKQTMAYEKERRMKFREKVNEKSIIMNPSTSEPISSESVTQWTPTVQGKSVPPHERMVMEAAVKTDHNRQSDEAADDEDTWPVCEGHNIEQRNCNMFECTGTINLLTALTSNYHWRAWDEAIDDRINYQINQLDQNFTLMMSLRLKVSVTQPAAGYSGHREHRADDDIGSDPSSTVRPISGHIFSVRSKLTTGSSLSINFETDGHGGIRVLQEKYGLSEMLPVRSGKLTLRDGDWHSLALSGRNGGFVTVYIDCQWINSFVLTKGSIELPQYPIVEVGQNVELRQLTVVPGEKSARLQCNSQPVPIHDVENRQVTNYFEHLN